MSLTSSGIAMPTEEDRVVVYPETQVHRAGTPRTIDGEPEVQRSSCEIKTSTRGHDIVVKSYVGSPVREACDEAMQEYQRVFTAMEAWLMGHRAGQ